jgi:hypothetical protein
VLRLTPEEQAARTTKCVLVVNEDNDTLHGVKRQK